MNNERLALIKQALEQTQPLSGALLEDVKWLIKTIEDQQKELDSWRNEFMGV
ncbi:hypothetical protein L1999_20205 [Neobacillus drentensis]|uniref:hypothetical protein n=1 Tax=Neobacillus drentensis TaxID=220684 RepID=UPI001F4416EE|nr:hypothetical protein [Neobacillus drentensis]ULT55407.1 hypothetical protein L1999_20205 [Neobacillus drentensis]